MFAKIIKNASWLMLAQAINKGVFVIITIYVARLFGNSVYGQFNYAFSFVMIFSVVADFGLNNLLIREIARNKEKTAAYVSNGLILKIIFSIITLIAIFIVSQVINKPATVNYLVFILSFFVIFNSYNTFAKAVYNAFEKMQFETYIKLVEGLTLLIYAMIVMFLYKNLYALTVGFSIVSFLTFLVSLHWIKKYFSQFNFRYDKKIMLFLLKESWPFGFSNIFVMLFFNLDTVMVSLIKGDVETGWYSAAYNFIFAFSMVTGLIDASFYPVLSRKFKLLNQLKNILKKYILTEFLIGIIFAALLFYFSNLLIIYVYGSSYLPAVQSLKILAMALPFMFLSNFLGVILSSTNRQKTALYVTGGNILLVVVLNFFLIHLYGSVGAAISALIGMVVTSVTLISIVKFQSIDSKFIEPTATI